MSARPALLPVALLGLVLLAGCATPADEPRPTPSSSATTSPSATPGPQPSPSATGTSGLTIACDDLVPAEVAYDWNANVAAITGHSPAAGSDAARVTGLGGTACALQNLSSGEITEIAATRLSAEDAEAVRADASALGATTTVLGGEGFFASGRAWVLAGDVWIVVTGPAIVSAEDAAPLTQAALAAV